MSRELCRARSKKVQKMGRDGLVEQDRATGEERRVGEKEADVSFGPERPVTERAADPARQRQRRQQARFRQENPERKTENPAVTDDWSVTPDAFATDGFAPGLDTSAPEIPDAAPAMRGAVDTPMLTPTPVRESGPIVIRRVRKPGEPDAKAPKETESGNRLKYDGAGESPRRILRHGRRAARSPLPCGQRETGRRRGVPQTGTPRVRRDIFPTRAGVCNLTPNGSRKPRPTAAPRSKNNRRGSFPAKPRNRNAFILKAQSRLIRAARVWRRRLTRRLKSA